jgi:hypothetical protein
VRREPVEVRHGKPPNSVRGEPVEPPFDKRRANGSVPRTANLSTSVRGVLKKSTRGEPVEARLGKPPNSVRGEPVEPPFDKLRANGSVPRTANLSTSVRGVLKKSTRGEPVEARLAKPPNSVRGEPVEPPLIPAAQNHT